jgi:hypothetical protein
MSLGMLSPKDTALFTLFSAALLLLVGCSFGNRRPTTQCGAGSYFTTLPVANRVDYVGVIPMGSVAPTLEDVFPADRISFEPWPDNLVAVPPTYSEFNVVSPGNDLSVMAVASRKYTATSIVDYTVFFKPCSGLRGYLQHLSSLSPAFAAKLTAANSSWNNGNGDVCVPGVDNWGDNYTECVSRFPKVTLAASELLGTGGKYRPLGFGLYDKSLTNPYLTPSYYTLSLSYYTNLLGFPINDVGVWEIVLPAYRDYLHSTCVLDRYPSIGTAPAVAFTTRSGVSLGAWNGANCGEFLEESLTSGASGNWFFTDVLNLFLETDGLNYLGADQSAIALVHDRVNLNTGLQLDYPVFSIGSNIPITGGTVGILTMGRYDFTVSFAGTTNRDFDSLAVGTEYCYSGLTRRDGASAFNGVIRVKMVDSQSMQFQAFGGGASTCGTTLIDASALTFVR